MDSGLGVDQVPHRLLPVSCGGLSQSRRQPPALGYLRPPVSGPSGEAQQHPFKVSRSFFLLNAKKQNFYE